MTSWLWLAVLVIGGGVLLLAMKLWGAQILAGLMSIAASKIWEAFKADAKGLETPEQLRNRTQEGRERPGGKDR